MKKDCDTTDECPDLYGICPERHDCPLYLETIGFDQEDDEIPDIPVELLGDE